MDAGRGECVLAGTTHRSELLGRTRFPVGHLHITANDVHLFISADLEEHPEKVLVVGSFGRCFDLRVSPLLVSVRVDSPRDSGHPLPNMGHSKLQTGRSSSIQPVSFIMSILTVPVPSVSCKDQTFHITERHTTQCVFLTKAVDVFTDIYEYLPAEVYFCQRFPIHGPT